MPNRGQGDRGDKEVKRCFIEDKVLGEIKRPKDVL
jgi:hypothetical protein